MQEREEKRKVGETGRGDGEQQLSPAREGTGAGGPFISTQAWDRDTAPPSLRVGVCTAPGT